MEIWSKSTEGNMNGLVLVCQIDRHLDGLVFRLNQKLGAGLVS